MHSVSAPAPAGLIRVISIVPRGSRLLTLSSLCNTFGSGVFQAISVFLLLRLGASLAVIGMAIAVGGATSVVVSPLLAQWLGRLNLKYGLIALHIARASLFVLLGWASAGVAVGIVSAALVFDRAASPLSQVIMTLTVPQEIRLRVLSVRRATVNVGLALGAGAGALILTLHSVAAYRVGLLINATSFLVAAVIVQRTRIPRASPNAKSFIHDHGRSGASLRLMAMLVSLTVCSLFDIFLTYAVAAIVVERHLPRELVPATYVLNLVLIVSLQIPWSSRLEAAGVTAHRAGAHAVVLTCSAVAIGGAVLNVGGWVAIAGVLLAAALVTGAELNASYCLWLFPMRLASDDKLAHATANLSAATNLAMTAGPIIFGSIAIRWGITGFLTVAVVLAVASIPGLRLMRSVEQAWSSD